MTGAQVPRRFARFYDPIGRGIPNFPIAGMVNGALFGRGGSAGFLRVASSGENASDYYGSEVLRKMVRRKSF